MSKDFIAPIQVVHLFVVDSTFHIENEPSQNMDLKVDVSYQDVHLLRNKAGERADLKLYVCGSLIDRDDARKKCALMCRSLFRCLQNCRSTFQTMKRAVIFSLMRFPWRMVTLRAI